MNLHMFTLQRPLRILCADVFRKVNIKKNPTLADLSSWDLARAHLTLQGNGVDVQELRCLFEGERFHRCGKDWAKQAVNPSRIFIRVGQLFIDQFFELAFE